MKRYPQFLAILVSLAFCSFCASAEEEKDLKHTKDSLAKVQEGLTKEKALLLDVRELAEWKVGHLKDARLLPLGSLRKNVSEKNEKELAKLKKSLPKKKILYCHCRSGRRCLVATKILRDLGYDARALKPGFEELVKEGFEPVEEPEKDIPKEFAEADETNQDDTDGDEG
jgi:rhodanese-related sulfurtransferase